MKKASFALGLLLAFWLGSACFAQGTDETRSTRGNVLQVRTHNGFPLSFHPIGNSPWFGGFRQIPNWKLKPGETEVQAVELASRAEGGEIKIRVSVFRGKYFDIRDFVGEYTINDKTVILEDLAKVGVVPFEVRIVAAPPSVSGLPSIENRTRSLVVSAEPTTSTLPSFKLRILNASDKPALAVAYKTIRDGRDSSSAMPRNRSGGALIEPGSTYETTVRYPTRITTESTGEVPETVAGLKLEIQSVIFADGSWEGDPVRAATFRAGILGEKIQVGRILELLRSPSAASLETLSPLAESLGSKIDLADVSSLAGEFSGLSKTQMEDIRSIAELTAYNFQKEFRSRFGNAAAFTPAQLADAVKTTISKCEARIASLP